MFTAVPGSQRGAENVGDCPANAGVYRLRLELQTAGCEGPFFGGVAPRIDDLERISLDVELDRCARCRFCRR